MSSTTQELSLYCRISSESNGYEKKKMRSYMIVTLFRGCSSNFEKYTADLDAEGNVKVQFQDVNVDSAYLRFQVFTHRMLLSDKHVGDVNVHVSELVSSQVISGQPLSATYELGKAFRKGKKCYLKLSYEQAICRKESPAVVSRAEKFEADSKCLAAAIGNDIALFKMVPSFRTPLVSLAWN